MNFEFPDLYLEKLDRGGKDRLRMRREGGQLGQQGDNLLCHLGYIYIYKSPGIRRISEVSTGIVAFWAL